MRTTAKTMLRIYNYSTNLLSFSQRHYVYVVSAVKVVKMSHLSARGRHVLVSGAWLAAVCMCIYDRELSRASSMLYRQVPLPTWQHVRLHCESPKLHLPRFAVDSLYNVMFDKSAKHRKPTTSTQRCTARCTACYATSPVQQIKIVEFLSSFDVFLSERSPFVPGRRWSNQLPETGPKKSRGLIHARTNTAIDVAGEISQRASAWGHAK